MARMTMPGQMTPRVDNTELAEWYKKLRGNGNEDYYVQQGVKAAEENATEKAYSDYFQRKEEEADRFQENVAQNLDANLEAIDRNRQKQLYEAAVSYERLEKYLPNYLKMSGLSGQGISENAAIRMGNDYANRRANANDTAFEQEQTARREAGTSVQNYLSQLRSARDDANLQLDLQRAAQEKADAEKLEALGKEKSSRKAQNILAYLEAAYGNAMGDDLLTTSELQELRNYYEAHKDDINDDDRASIESALDIYGSQAQDENLVNLANQKDFKASDGNKYRIVDTNVVDMNNEDINKSWTGGSEGGKNDFKKEVNRQLKKQGYSSMTDSSIKDGTVVEVNRMLNGDLRNWKTFYYVYYGGAWYMAEKV
jgi:hypothetical protein